MRHRSPALHEHAPHNAMEDRDEIARFHDRCSDLMRTLLEALAAAPDRSRPFPEIEDEIGWPRRRIASVLGGVFHLRQTEFAGRRPYRFYDAKWAPSGRWEIWMDAQQASAVRSAQRGGRRMCAPERRAQTRDPAAFLVHHEHRARRQHAPQFSHQRRELRPVLDVPREQNDAGGRVGPEQRRFLREQLRAGDIGDGGLHFRSRGLAVVRLAIGCENSESLTRETSPSSSSCCHREEQTEHRFAGGARR